MFGAEPGAVGRSGRRMRMRAFAVVALTFVAGLAVGWAVASRVASAGRMAAAPTLDGGRNGGGVGGRGGPGGGGGGRMPMQQRLGLTAGQCAAIDSVFESHRGQIDAFWRGPGGQLRAILDSTRADVRALLDPTQRATYDSLQARHRPGDGRPDRGRRFCDGPTGRRDGSPGRGPAPR